MAVMASRPTPGHAKMVSVTTAPPRRKPYWRPTTVTTGMSALVSACLATTPAGGTPLARAVVTYSRPSTSSMPERVRRLMMAIEVVAEEPDGHDGDPEDRHGERRERGARGRVVDPRGAPHRRDEAERNAHEHGQDHAHRGELEGGGKAAQDLRGHGSPRTERTAEIALEGAGEKRPVLHVERALEAELRAHALHHELRGVGAGDQAHWIARHHVHDGEGEEGHAEEHRHRLE